MVMRKHQRYFPVYSSSGDGNGAGGKLMPLFVTVANGPVDIATVAAGNEAVLRYGLPPHYECVPQVSVDEVTLSYSYFQGTL